MNWLHEVIRMITSSGKHLEWRRSAWVDERASIPESCCLGERVKIKGKVVFEEDVFVNDDCVFMSGDKSTICVGKGTRFGPKCMVISEGVVGTKDLVIGSGCRVYGQSIILKNGSIGNGCVVGAGSVVTKAFPEGSVVAGNPAKIIKKEGERNEE